MKKVHLTTRFPFFSKWYFVTFVFGADSRRSSSSGVWTAAERRKNSPWALSFLFLTGLMWVSLAVLVFTLLSLYLLKTYAGIDLVAENSPLQEWLHFLKLCHNIAPR